MDSLAEKKQLVKRIQRIVFRLMCAVDDFCKENGILYFLSGGTCLGAVRHQGFIPWDDDADLMMPRPDYERFCRLFASNPPPGYAIGSLATDPAWKTKHAKVWDVRTHLSNNLIGVTGIGVFADILPIDGLPENPRRRRLHYKWSKALCGLGNSCIKTRFVPGESHLLLKRATALATRPFSSRFFFKWMNANAAKYDFWKSPHVGAIMAAHYGERETIDRESMASATLLPFEGRPFPVPAGYHRYLSNLYGDYMTVPPGAEEAGYVHLDKWELSLDADSPLGPEDVP